eukprot:Gregarina_sp_Poly_1__5490@NODE_28_length_19636_cov_263_287087_g25_i0_p10_GENE_NODE_28_length_19636_cov_263_287087_g25_i0NODE_28_length_19636_cov_263_287087_g25_i0_p10_ORF_typecomplete_len290_score34_27_NODE_28_length_19636_cov_263_287087_g25_i01839919268
MSKLQGSGRVRASLYLSMLLPASVAVLTADPDPSPLMAPVYSSHTPLHYDVVSPSDGTGTSIRAPVRRLDSILGQVFLENSQETANAETPDAKARGARPNTPLSSDSDAPLKGMKPVIPSPGYEAQVNREYRGSNQARHSSHPIVTAIPQQEDSAARSLPEIQADSRTERLVNQRLDETFGLAAPQRSTYQRRPGGRFGDRSSSSTRMSAEIPVFDGPGRTIYGSRPEHRTRDPQYSAGYSWNEGRYSDRPVGPSNAYGTSWAPQQSSSQALDSWRQSQTWDRRSQPYY